MICVFVSKDYFSRRDSMAKLHPKSLAMAMGTVMALTLAALTVIIIIPGGGQGNTFGKIGHIFIGYNPTLRPLQSLIIGPMWAFASGYVLGWAFAIIYNKYYDIEAAAVEEEKSEEN
jgi:hypothetical protein